MCEFIVTVGCFTATDKLETQCKDLQGYANQIVTNCINIVVIVANLLYFLHTIHLLHEIWAVPLVL